MVIFPPAPQQKTAHPRQQGCRRAGRQAGQQGGNASRIVLLPDEHRLVCAGFLIPGRIVPVVADPSAHDVQFSVTSGGSVSSGGSDSGGSDCSGGADCIGYTYATGSKAPPCAASADARTAHTDTAAGSKRHTAAVTAAFLRFPARMGSPPFGDKGAAASCSSPLRSFLQPPGSPGGCFGFQDCGFSAFASGFLPGSWHQPSALLPAFSLAPGFSHWLGCPFPTVRIGFVSSPSS